MTTWKDSLMRRDEVKAAFLEGHQAGLADDEPTTPKAARTFGEEAWAKSNARKQLQKPLAD